MNKKIEKAIDKAICEVADKVGKYFEGTYKGYKIEVGLDILFTEKPAYYSYIYDLKTGEMVDGGSGFDTFEEALDMAKGTVDSYK